MTKIKYPAMLYQGGVVGDDWRIVANPDEEAAARQDGYLAPGDVADVASAGEGDAAKAGAGKAAKGGKGK